MYNMHLFLFIMCIIKKIINHIAKQTKQTTAEGLLLLVTNEDVRDVLLLVEEAARSHEPSMGTTWLGMWVTSRSSEKPLTRKLRPQSHNHRNWFWPTTSVSLEVDYFLRAPRKGTRCGWHLDLSLMRPWEEIPATLCLNLWPRELWASKWVLS